jgi:hypothetical protein
MTICTLMETQTDVPMEMKLKIHRNFKFIVQFKNLFYFCFRMEAKLAEKESEETKLVAFSNWATDHIGCNLLYVKQFYRDDEKVHKDSGLFASKDISVGSAVPFRVYSFSSIQRF